MICPGHTWILLALPDLMNIQAMYKKGLLPLVSGCSASISVMAPFVRRIEFGGLMPYCPPNV